MKKLILFLLLFLFSNCLLIAQKDNLYSNGMIYPDSTISYFKNVVDSITSVLNNSELSRKYFTKKQSKGYYFKFESDTADLVKEDLEKGILFEDFKIKYLKREVLEKVIVHKEVIYDSSCISLTRPNSELYFYLADLSNKKNPQMIANFAKYKNDDLKGEYAYIYSDNNSLKQANTLDVFYFTEDFHSIELKEEYARMIEYSYSLIDTNHAILLEEKRFPEEGSNNYIIKFNEYIDKATEEGKTEQEIVTTLEFQNLFNLAIDEAYNMYEVNSGIVPSYGFGTELLEYYVEKYDSPKTALYFKRSRSIIKIACGWDNVDNNHYQEIFRLVANTLNKDLFFRCHVNNMCESYPDFYLTCYEPEVLKNGFYEPFTDISFSKVKELEVMNINIFDFFIGITLDIENPISNNIYPCLHTLGGNLTRVENLDEIDSKFYAILSDGELDLYNRIRINYLFQIYNINLKKIDKVRSENNVRAFDKLVLSLPKEERKFLKRIY